MASTKNVGVMDLQCFYTRPLARAGWFMGVLGSGTMEASRTEPGILDQTYEEDSLGRPPTPLSGLTYNDSHHVIHSQELSIH